MNYKSYTHEKALKKPSVRTSNAEWNSKTKHKKFTLNLYPDGSSPSIVHHNSKYSDSYINWAYFGDQDKVKIEQKKVAATIILKSSRIWY